MLEIRNENDQLEPKIMVIGVGGGGNNAIDRMVEAHLKDVEYIAVNTDIQVLSTCAAQTRLQIGKKITKGYGAGADPQIGETAANESEEDIRKAIEGADMCIVTCGMGGGTGTGAAPVISKLCKDAGILTVAVVTTPFSFENTPRIKAAENGIEKLKSNVDTLLVIPNDKLIGLTDKPLLLEDAFEMADSVLRHTIQGITNIVRNKGIVNIDFNDLRTTLLNKGIGHLGIGTVDVECSVVEAVKQAINSPLLDTSIEGAENLLINTSGRVNIAAVNEAISYVRETAGGDVNIIWGTVMSKEQDDKKIVVTLIATGMTESRKTEKRETIYSRMGYSSNLPLSGRGGGGTKESYGYYNQNSGKLDVQSPIVAEFMRERARRNEQKGGMTDKEEKVQIDNKDNSYEKYELEKPNGQKKEIVIPPFLQEALRRNR